MAEETQKPEAASEEISPRYEALKIYVKDASFEAPATPEIFLNQKAKPEVGVEVELDYKSMEEEQGILELVLSITITSRLEDRVMYLAEVKQAGIFQVLHPQPEARRFITEVTSAHMLLPFAREAPNSLITKGGFSSFLLTPVNFEAIYKDKLKREEEMNSADAADTPEAIN